MRFFAFVSKGLVFWGVSLGLFSCTSMSVIPVDVLKPAGYSVAPEILSVAVVDHSYPFRDDSVHIIEVPDDKTVVDTIWVDDFGRRVIETMSETLEQRAFFDSVFVYPHSLNQPPDGEPYKDIPLSTIRALTKVYDAQAVIALEAVEYGSHIRVNDLGEFYYVTLDAEAALYWKLYDEDGYVLDAYLQRDSIFWDNSQATYHSEARAIPPLRQAIETMAIHLGQLYPDRIAPRWETVSRYYFSSGHHMFSRANDLVKISNWESAAKVWYYAYENGNKKQKARAAFNLALSHEVRGDFLEAIAWAQISSQHFEETGLFGASQNEKEMAEKYVTELQSRLKDVRKLEEQIGSAAL